MTSVLFICRRITREQDAQLSWIYIRASYMCHYDPHFSHNIWYNLHYYKLYIYTIHDRQFYEILRLCGRCTRELQGLKKNFFIYSLNLSTKSTPLENWSSQICFICFRKARLSDAVWFHDRQRNGEWSFDIDLRVDNTNRSDFFARVSSFVPSLPISTRATARERSWNIQGSLPLLQRLEPLNEAGLCKK